MYLCSTAVAIYVGFWNALFVRVESTEIVIFSLKYFVCRIPESLIYITSFISLYLQTSKVRPQILLSRVPFAKANWYGTQTVKDMIQRHISAVGSCLLLFALR